MPIELPLVRNGVEYRVYYITTSEYRPKGLKLFRDASAHLFTSGSITGLLVTANGKVVEDEDTIAEVFSLFRAASFMYEPHSQARAPSAALRKTSRNRYYISLPIQCSSNSNSRDCSSIPPSSTPRLSVGILSFEDRTARPSYSFRERGANGRRRW